MTTATHDHTLDGIVGYHVRQTIVNGDVLGFDGPTVARIDDPTRYVDAIVVAHDLRRPNQSWAVVDNVYGCGCTDRSLP